MPKPTPGLTKAVQAFEEEVRVVAQIDAGTLWDRYLGEFLNEWAKLNRQGLEGEPMEKALQMFLEDLSEKPIEDLARKSSTVAYNEGRTLAMEESGIQYAVRSELLHDPNICDRCAELDGTVEEVGTPEFDQIMAPAQCAGGDRCRGFNVPLTEGV